MERLPVEINSYSEHYLLLCANIASDIRTKSTSVTHSSKRLIVSEIIFLKKPFSPVEIN